VKGGVAKMLEDMVMSCKPYKVETRLLKTTGRKYAHPTVLSSKISGELK